MSNTIKDFGQVVIMSGQNKEFGANGTGALSYGYMDNYAVAMIDIQSAGAGVATITFNAGNGYSGSEVVNAGDVADFLIYGSTSLKIAASGANITATVKLIEPV